MNPKGDRRGPAKRAQALVETALVIPVLVFLMLGAADLGRAFYLSIEIAGASRAGMRNGVLSPATDIGAAARNEPNSAIPNTTAAWGLTGPGGTNAACTGAAGNCGDTQGCASTGFQSGQSACFAIRTCLSMTGGVCGSWSTGWGVRPQAASDQVLDVRVVYRFKPVTPFISNFASPDGFFYLTVDTLGIALY